MLNPDYVRALITHVNNSPFPQFLPFEIADVSIDEATVTMMVNENHYQPLRTVHGGIIATLIDTATFWAAFANVPEDDGMVSVDLKLNYLKPALSGLLTAKSRCIRGGRTLSYAECSVSDDAGNLLAHGTSTLMTIRGQGFDLGVPKFIQQEG